ncbi:MAG: uroporphyrinogen-III synthase, partial [Hydrogenophaga sp.]|nr:uroporphyrinogen-III synthase [Hydrogenophaga sp.]
SSEALAHLADAQPQANWGAAHALVTHPRIAERARQLGFGRVVQTRPALSDVLSALESNWSPP